MLSSPFKKLRNIFFLAFLTLSISACSYHKNPINGSNNFESLVEELVDESAAKIKKNIQFDDIILVSDFVNIDDLKNKSELGFLLSSILKDKLVSLDIIVREVEFANEFQLGRKGLNVLIRDKSKIISNKVSKERFAVVGTYSITNRSLNVFIKLIDIRTGNIHASSFERTSIDEEILGLEKREEKRILSPRIVL